FPDKIFEQEATEVTEISAKRNYSVSSVSSCSILQFRNILCFSAQLCILCDKIIFRVCIFGLRLRCAKSFVDLLS
ncbi:hypothetical protein LLG95_08300, partial [bacterium]|nr:hypothetical protein [bacterium]